jgi:hypothetical protein
MAIERREFTIKFLYASRTIVRGCVRFVGGDRGHGSGGQSETGVTEDRHIDAALETEGGRVLCRHTKPALLLRVVDEIWPEDRVGLRPVRGTGSAYFCSFRLSVKTSVGSSSTLEEDFLMFLRVLETS